jgi:tRNA G18 (ribose-2'-O)-methylase SpoU
MNDNLGTLLRTRDAVGACLVVPRHPGVDAAVAKGQHPAPRWLRAPGPRADKVVEIPMIGTGLSLNVAVAGSLVDHRLAGMS